jgi:hypothetical protein
MFNTLLNSKGSKRKCLWISMRKDQNIFILFDFQFTSEHILISYIIYPPQTFIRFDSAVSRQPSAMSMIGNNPVASFAVSSQHFHHINVHIYLQGLIWIKLIA